MGIVIVGIVAGLIGTLAMDLLNNLVARTGMLQKIDVAMIGRMAAGWTHGCFRYGHPGEMERVGKENLYGYITHYAIGVILAIIFLLGWDLWVGGPASPVWALAYGISTTIASLFFVFPAMGLGVFGRRSPEGVKASLSPLANHLFYGVGMAIGIALLEP